MFKRVHAADALLSSAVEALTAAATSDRTQLLPAARAVVGELGRDPLTASVEVTLAAAALPWSGIGGRLRRWSAEGRLDGDLLADAAAALSQSTGSTSPLGPRHGGRRSDFEEPGALEAELSAAGDPRAPAPRPRGPRRAHRRSRRLEPGAPGAAGRLPEIPLGAGRRPGAVHLSTRGTAAAAGVEAGAIVPIAMISTRD